MLDVVRQLGRAKAQHLEVCDEIRSGVFGWHGRVSSYNPWMRSASFRWACTALLNAGIVIGMGFLMHRVAGPTLIPCIAPPFGSALVACGFALILDLVILPRLRLDHPRMAAILLGVLAMLLAWFGLYPISPLGFGRNPRPIIEGFRILRYGRPPSVVGQRDVVSVTAGSMMAIEPMELPGVQVACHWYSVAGGAFDDPDSCDVAYVAPADRTFDYLRVLARPSCGLPNDEAELRASIEP